MQKADILGARTFAMRVWLKPDRMAALNISPSDVRDAPRGEQLSLRARPTKGSMTSINLVANTNLRPSEEFKQLVVRERTARWCASSDIADVDLGAEITTRKSASTARTRRFMGIWSLPTANTLDVIKAVREAMPEIQKQLPAGMKGGVPYDATALHPGRHRRSAQDPDRDAAHRRPRHLPLPRIGRGDHHPGGGDPDLTHRRGHS